MPSTYERRNSAAAIGTRVPSVETAGIDGTVSDGRPLGIDPTMATPRAWRFVTDVSTIERPTTTSAFGNRGRYRSPRTSNAMPATPTASVSGFVSPRWVRTYQV